MPPHSTFGPRSAMSHEPIRRKIRRLSPVVIAAAVVIGLLLWRAYGPTTEVPFDAVLSANGWVDEQRCAECHREISAGFARTGHARTLMRATQPASWNLLSQIDQTEPALSAETTVERGVGGIRAVCRSKKGEQSAPIDWCFGSGTHARTWVGLLGDSWGATEMVEFRWTWYSAIDSFDRTPGQPAHPGSGYFAGIGLLFDQPRSRRCFACHATYVPIAFGKIEDRAIKPGVTCQRCHGTRRWHVLSRGRIVDASWREADRAESVRRCAQCHRRPEETPADDIRPDNREIVRFQPVGLEQSACYQQSPTMTCLTCHDPHRTLQDQDSLGAWQCLQCHDPAQRPGERPCSAEHQVDCLSCHMPKVRTASPVWFSDHWIRIRDDDEPAS